MPNLTDIRRRTVEFRAAEDASEGVVRGYVTTWDDPYKIGWGWNEEIARGAFTESLADQSALPIMYQHDWDAGPIGVTRAVVEDDHGLYVEVELFLDDDRARAIWRAMAAGALREWSIGFYPEEITELVETSTDRVMKGRLAEASVVVRGANPSTSTIEVRDAATAQAEADAAAERAAAERAAAERAAAELPDFVLERIHEPHVRALIRDGLF